MMQRLLLYMGVFGATYFLALKLPVAYAYEDFKDYVMLLSGVSGMVFTIMGIWIAFLYPNALSRLVNTPTVANADFSETISDTKRLEQIVAAVLKSGLVAVALLLVVILKIFLHRSALYVDFPSYWKSAALAFASTLTVLQVEAVASVVFANVLFINDLHRKRQDRKLENDL